MLICDPYDGVTTADRSSKSRWSTVQPQAHKTAVSPHFNFHQLSSLSIKIPLSYIDSATYLISRQRQQNIIHRCGKPSFVEHTCTSSQQDHIEPISPPLTASLAKWPLVQASTSFSSLHSASLGWAYPGSYSPSTAKAANARLCTS